MTDVPTEGPKWVYQRIWLKVYFFDEVVHDPAAARREGQRFEEQFKADLKQRFPGIEANFDRTVYRRGCLEFEGTLIAKVLAPAAPEIIALLSIKREVRNFVVRVINFCFPGNVRSLEVYSGPVSEDAPRDAGKAFGFGKHLARISNLFTRHWRVALAEAVTVAVLGVLLVWAVSSRAEQDAQQSQILFELEGLNDDVATLSERLEERDENWVPQVVTNVDCPPARVIIQAPPRS